MSESQSSATQAAVTLEATLRQEPTPRQHILNNVIFATTGFKLNEPQLGNLPIPEPIQKEPWKSASSTLANFAQYSPHLRETLSVKGTDWGKIIQEMKDDLGKPSLSDEQVLEEYSNMLWKTKGEKPKVEKQEEPQTLGKQFQKEEAREGNILRISMNSNTEASQEHPERNEDSLFCMDNAFGVFDGLGGYKGGDFASQTVSKYVEAEMRKIASEQKSLEETRQQVAQILIEAHRHLQSEKTKENINIEAGTTASIGYIWTGTNGEKKIIVGNVGDSRVYLYRDGLLTQITLDDSGMTMILSENEQVEIQTRLSNYDVNLTGIRTNDLPLFNYRNMVSQYIGYKRSPVPKIFVFDLLPGDIVLACSDGISDNIPDPDIAKIIRSNGQESSQQLINEAKRISKLERLRSKFDDMSAIIIWGEKEQSQEPPAVSLPPAFVPPPASISLSQEPQVVSTGVVDNIPFLSGKLESALNDITDDIKKNPSASFERVVRSEYFGNLLSSLFGVHGNILADVTDNRVTFNGENIRYSGVTLNIAGSVTYQSNVFKLDNVSIDIRGYGLMPHGLADNKVKNELSKLNNPNFSLEDELKKKLNELLKRKQVEMSQLNMRIDDGNIVMSYKGSPIKK